jgi:diguanylate cyclase (GGDEF)-like protein
VPSVERPQSLDGRERRFRAYAYTLGLTAALAVVWLLVQERDLLLQELFPITVFSLFIGFSWYFSFTLFPRASLSISLDMAYLMTALCVLPPPMPLAVALGGSVLGCYLRGRDVKVRQNPFRLGLCMNTGSMVFTALAGQWLAVLMAHRWQFRALTWWSLLSVVALFVTYTLTNLAVMSVAVLLRGERLMPSLIHYLRYIPSLEVFTIPLCLGLSLLYAAAGVWGFLPLAATILLGSGLLKKLDKARTELSGTLEQLQHRSRELRILNTIGQEITRSLDPERIFQQVSANVPRILDAEFLFLSLHHGGPQEAYVEYLSRHGEVQPRPERALAQEFTRWMLEARRALVVGDIGAERRSLPCSPVILDPSVRSILAVPLTGSREAIGLLCVESPRTAAYGIDQVSVFTTIAQQAAVAIENARNFQTATVDHLTRLYLRDFFFRKLSEEQVRARRYGSTFALLMLDLDHFKEINDKRGHLAGDRFLQRAGEVIRDTVRAADIPCRYGGDEFCILLPETDREGATSIAERIRQQVAAMEVRIGEDLVRTTISIGVACYPADFPGSLQGMLEKADEALYSAKAGGCDRVVSASSEPPVPKPEAAPSQG